MINYHIDGSNNAINLQATYNGFIGLTTCDYLMLAVLQVCLHDIHIVLVRYREFTPFIITYERINYFLKSYFTFDLIFDCRFPMTRTAEFTDFFHYLCYDSLLGGAPLMMGRGQWKNG